MSETPGRSTPAPCLGQHNEEIYAGMLGLSQEELTVLCGSKVI